MLDTNTLRSILKEIYGVDDKYLVPMDMSWYVPTYDRTNKIGTWIGYRILSIKPNVRAGYTGSGYSKSIKGRFRLAFIGREAEQLALQTLLFDDRLDVVQAFEKAQAQLNYVSRELLTYPVKEGGLNNNLCWIVDFDFQSFYNADIQYGPWTKDTPEPSQEWFPSQPPKSKSDRLESGELIVHS